MVQVVTTVRGVLVQSLFPKYVIDARSLIYYLLGGVRNVGQRQTGKDCRFNLLGLIPFGLPNMEEAVDKALEKGKGNVMVDEVTEYENYWVVLGFVSCINVEGTVLTAPASTLPKAVK